MLSSVLSSALAIKMSVQIIETFVQRGKMANNYEELAFKIQQIESQNNEQFQQIYKVLQRLLSKPKNKSRQRIGYKKDKL